MAVDAPFSLDGIAQEVAAIKLYARFLAPHFQHPARRRLAHARRQGQRALFLFGEDEVVVVPETVADLFVVGVDALADGVRFPEVERRARHWRQLAQRDLHVVDRRVAVRVDGQFVAEDVAAAGQVEVRMIGQVDRRGPVGHRVEGDAQLVIGAQFVNHRGVQVAGVALLAVGAQVTENQAGRLGGAEGFGGPQAAVKTIDAAVQVVGAVVLIQVVLLAVQRKAGIGDAVAVAADQGAEIVRFAQVGRHVVEAAHHVGQLAVAVRHVDFGDDAAEVEDLDDHAVGVVKAAGRSDPFRPWAFLYDWIPACAGMTDQWARVLLPLSVASSPPRRRGSNVTSSDRWLAEYRHPLVVPLQRLDVGVTVRVPQRVADDLGVSPCMINQHDGFTIVADGEAVVARAVHAVLEARLQHRLRALGPRGGIEHVGVVVRPQDAHRVVFVGGAGRVADEDLAVLFQHRRAFVDPEAADLPVEFRLAQHDRRAAQLPRGFHRRDVQVGVALDGDVLLRPQVVQLALVGKRGGVQAEGVDAGIDLAHEFPLALERVGVGVTDRVHAVLEQLVLDLAARCSSEVHIPGAVVEVDLGRPNQFAVSARIGLVPHVDLLGVHQAGNGFGATQLDAVVLRHRRGEVIIAVAVTDDERVGALCDQRLQDVRVVDCLVAHAHQRMEEARDQRHHQHDAVQRERGLLVVRLILEVREQPAHQHAGDAHARLLAHGDAAVRKARDALAGFHLAVVDGLGNGGPEHRRMQVHHERQHEVQHEGQHHVARLDHDVDHGADHAHGDLRPAEQLDLAVRLGNPGGRDHRQDGRHHADRQEGGNGRRVATEVILGVIDRRRSAHHVTDGAHHAHAAQDQPLVVLQQQLQLFGQRLALHHVAHALGGGEKAEQEQAHAHHRHHRHRGLVAHGRIAAAPAVRQQRHHHRHHEGADLGEEQAVAVGRQPVLGIVRQAAGQRDVRHAHAGRHQGHDDVGRIGPYQLGAVFPVRRGEHEEHADAVRDGQEQQPWTIAAHAQTGVAVGQLTDDQVADGARHLHNQEQQGQVRGLEAIDVGVEEPIPHAAGWLTTLRKCLILPVHRQPDGAIVAAGIAREGVLVIPVVAVLEVEQIGAGQVDGHLLGQLVAERTVQRRHGCRDQVLAGQVGRIGRIGIQLHELRAPVVGQAPRPRVLFVQAHDVVRQSRQAGERFARQRRIGRRIDAAFRIRDVRLQAEAAQPARQAVIKLLVRQLHALQVALVRVERPRGVVRDALVGLRHHLVDDVAVEVMAEHGAAHRTGGREIPFQRRVEVLRGERFQVRVAARRRGHVGGAIGLDVGSGGIELREVGARHGFAVREARQQVLADRQLEVRARQHFGVGRVGCRRHVDVAGVGGHVVVGVDGRIGFRDPHTHHAFDRILAQVEAHARFHVRRVVLFGVLEERGRIDGARCRRTGGGGADRGRIVDQVAGARRRPARGAIVFRHRRRGARQAGNAGHGHARDGRHAAFDGLDRAGVTLVVTRAEAHVLEHAVAFRGPGGVRAPVGGIAAIVAIAVKELRQHDLGGVGQARSRVLRVGALAGIGLDVCGIGGGAGIEDRVDPVVLADGAGHFGARAQAWRHAPLGADGALPRGVFGCPRLRGQDGVAVGRVDGLGLVGARDLGHRDLVGRRGPRQAHEEVGLVVVLVLGVQAFRVHFQVRIGLPLQRVVGGLAFALAVHVLQAHQVGARQIGGGRALIDREGLEHALLVEAVLHRRHAQQRAHLADAGMPAVRNHARQFRVGGLGLVLVLGAHLGAGRKALEVERTVGAHVDHAGHAALQQVRALRLVHVHALQHGGRNVGQLDVTADGAEYFAAVEQRGDAGQAANEYRVGFAGVAAHLDAAHAGQRLRHVRVGEFADIVGHDGVDDVVAVLLELLRRFRRAAHAGDGDHGGVAVSRCCRCCRCRRCRGSFLGQDGEGAEQAGCRQDRHTGFEDEAMLRLGPAGPECRMVHVSPMIHAGQLDLAVHGLVAHTQQCPVRNPEPEAVGGDGGAFHIERNRPALAETPLGRTLRQQLPVAVVGAGHGAGAHHALQVVAGQLRDFGHGRLDGHLHLGQRRDRHPQRQVFVEHVVFAHVAVRQHVVAQFLGVAQPGAVAQHQPAMRAQHGNVVGDGLGVGRSHADIDHRNAGTVGADQVVTGHLRQARRLGAVRVARFHGLAHPARDQVARFDKRDVAAVHIVRRLAHQLVAQLDELVDIKLVIGKQHELLEVFARRARVVAQALQRIIDARRREQRQRLRFARRRLVGAVGDAVVHGGQVGQVEHVAHQQAPFGGHAAFDVFVLGKREMNRDRLRAGPDLDAHLLAVAMVFQQQLELLGVIPLEQVGPGERGFVGAGAGDEPERQARIGAGHGIGMDPHERVAGAHVFAHVLAGHEAFHGVAQSQFQPNAQNDPASNTAHDANASGHTFRIARRRAAARRNPGRPAGGHRRPRAGPAGADCRPAHPHLPPVERAGRPGGRAPDCRRRGSRPDGGAVDAARDRAAGGAGGHCQGRRGLAAGRRRHAGRAAAGMPGRRQRRGRGHDGSLCAAPGRHRPPRMDRGSAAGRPGAGRAAGTPRSRLARRSRLRDLHVGIDRQTQRHPDHPAQHLPLPAQRKRGAAGDGRRQGVPGLFGGLRHVVRRDLDCVPGRRHAVARPQGHQRRSRSPAARAGGKRRDGAARGAYPAVAVQPGRAVAAADQPGRRGVSGSAGGALVAARPPDVQHLRSYRGDGVGQPGAPAAGPPRHHRHAAAQLRPDGHCRDRGCARRSGQPAPAAGGRGGRIVHHRSGPGRRLPGPPRPDGRKIPGQPVGQRPARRAAVPHGRPGAHRRGRGSDVPGPRRRPGQDPRLPRGAGRDRGAAGRAAGRGHGGGPAAQGRRHRPAGGLPGAGNGRDARGQGAAPGAGRQTAAVHGARPLPAAGGHAAPDLRQDRPQGLEGAAAGRSAGGQRGRVGPARNASRAGAVCRAGRTVPRPADPAPRRLLHGPGRPLVLCRAAGVQPARGPALRPHDGARHLSAAASGQNRPGPGRRRQRRRRGQGRAAMDTAVRAQTLDVRTGAGGRHAGAGGPAHGAVAGALLHLSFLHGRPRRLGAARDCRLGGRVPDRHGAGICHRHCRQMADRLPAPARRLSAVEPDVLPLVAGRPAGGIGARLPAQRLLAQQLVAARARREDRQGRHHRLHDAARARPAHHRRQRQHRQRRQFRKCPRGARHAQTGPHHARTRRLRQLLRGHGGQHPRRGAGSPGRPVGAGRRRPRAGRAHLVRVPRARCRCIRSRAPAAAPRGIERAQPGGRRVLRVRHPAHRHAVLHAGLPQLRADRLVRRGGLDAVAAGRDHGHPPGALLRAGLPRQRGADRADSAAVGRHPLDRAAAPETGPLGSAQQHLLRQVAGEPDPGIEPERPARHLRHRVCAVLVSPAGRQGGQGCGNLHRAGRGARHAHPGRRDLYCGRRDAGRRGNRRRLDDHAAHRHLQPQLRRQRRLHPGRHRAARAGADRRALARARQRPHAHGRHVAGVSPAQPARTRADQRLSGVAHVPPVAAAPAGTGPDRGVPHRRAARAGDRGGLHGGAGSDAGGRRRPLGGGDLGPDPGGPGVRRGELRVRGAAQMAADRPLSQTIGTHVDAVRVAVRGRDQPVRGDCRAQFHALSARHALAAPRFQSDGCKNRQGRVP
uniref:Uncharacterized protein n=1 Tax=Tanacetum cinerariifolium TaxID=118510 RepID=A0A699GFD7_TANCI|nr:hypothetical protein [Tanacetum cinerariifolium]